MPSPYIRTVKADALPIDGLNIVIDESRAVLRILSKRSSPVDAMALSSDEQSVTWEESDASQLLSTQKLKSPFIEGSPDKYFVIDEEKYVIVAEGILDKNDSRYAKSWVPGAHFVFWFDPIRGIFIDLKPSFTYFDKRNTADYIKYKGGLWLFDLWVRNQNSPLTKCCRSITVAPNVTFVSNLKDFGEEWPAETVMQGDQSRWLNLAYDLTPSSTTVTPNSWVTFTLKVLDGKTLRLAEDVSWDGYIVEAVDGYAPHKRVNVVNGKGEFRVKALDLEPGEKLRVKINQRFFSSRVEAEVDVVAPH